MACNSFAVASALVAINTRCTAATVIVRIGGKGFQFVIRFFIAAVINFKTTEVTKGVYSYLFFLFLLILLGLVQGGGYFGVDKSI
eukprot:6623621-Ditylum_brightwellii.AAC.1